ncbi:S8/S53 family peptidase [Lysinibacter cavernae]|uniref:Subtilisin family serine protease n=1 Tax=Lysinibacter cavernae TaxID=1640652 RepID=A0A7X5R249_9MICO|nr:S8/S53 family peptidase [Lysinibacter cavernae]NIH53990.1 subtilisin family serine protease [Lysinibacter cavernae]
MKHTPEKRHAIVRLGLGVGIAALLLSATPASAVGEPGLWYFDRYGVTEAHAEGYTGQGVKIAVIDGQINPDLPELAGANLTVKEPSYCETSLTDSTRLPAASSNPGALHGTAMVSLVASNGVGVGGQQAPKGVAPGAEVTLYTVMIRYDGSKDVDCFRDGEISQGNTAMLGEAITDAINDGADIISLSMTSAGLGDAKDAYIRGLRQGVIFLAGVSNNKAPTLAGSLAALNGLVTIQGMDENALIQEIADIPDKRTDLVGPGSGIATIEENFSSYSVSSGSSNATAITSAMLAIVKSKYPSATSNQLIQSLIHNTGPDDHDLVFDETGYWGYGPVSLQHMLREDPAQYPDENPLINKDSKYDVVFPTYEEIYGDDTVATSPPTPEKKPRETSKGSVEIGVVPSGNSGLPVIAIVGSGTVVVLVLAALGTWLVLSRRRKRVLAGSNYGDNGQLPTAYPQYPQSAPPANPYER